MRHQWLGLRYAKVKTEAKHGIDLKIVVFGQDKLVRHDHYTQGTCGGADNLDCVRSAVTTFEEN